jgi:hypothetical protein
MREKITNGVKWLRYFLRRAMGCARFIPFLGRQKMPPTPAREIPNVDFRVIPEEFTGCWVVLRLGAEQVVLSSAPDPREAMRLSQADPRDPSIVLTQVPEIPAAARMKRSG